MFNPVQSPLDADALAGPRVRMWERRPRCGIPRPSPRRAAVGEHAAVTGGFFLGLESWTTANGVLGAGFEVGEILGEDAVHEEAEGQQ